LEFLLRLDVLAHVILKRTGTSVGRQAFAFSIGKSRDFSTFCDPTAQSIAAGIAQYIILS
jgi:hypothetical protein